MNKRMINIAAVILLFVGSVSVRAWSTEAPPEGGRHMAAIAACTDKSEGARVEIMTPRGEAVNAVCRLIDGRLVAVPEGRFPGHGTPPPDGPQSRQ